MTKANTLTPIDYCARAISTDETRYNMTGAYRDGSRLVATDGHRLHLVEGLPDMGKGFLDGRAGEFPHYQAVLPERSKLTTVATVQLNKKQTEHLKRLVKTYKRKDCDCIVESDCENGALVIRGYHVTDCEALNGEFVVRIPADGLKPFKMGLNLRYLVEALLSDYITPPFTLETEAPSQDGSTKPLVIRYDMPQAYIGVIMPLRIDRILKGRA